MSLSTSLVAFWELEAASGTRNDAVGSNHLTDNNTVTQGTGKVGNAAQFTRANSEFLSHSSNATLQMGDIDFSICAWINPASLNEMMVVTKDDDAANSRDYTLDVYNASGLLKTRFYTNGSGGGIVAPSAADITLGAWTFLMAIHDSVANTLFLSINDGLSETGGTGGVAPDVSAAVFMIGAREYSGFESYFDGLIDQVGLWKRALSAAEVTALYNGGAGLSYAAISGGGGGAAPLRRNSSLSGLGSSGGFFHDPLGYPNRAHRKAA